MESISSSYMRESYYSGVVEGENGRLLLLEGVTVKSRWVKYGSLKHVLLGDG